jgi:hypothetical protein
LMRPFNQSGDIADRQAKIILVIDDPDLRVHSR